MQRSSNRRQLNWFLVVILFVCVVWITYCASFIVHYRLRRKKDPKFNVNDQFDIENEVQSVVKQDHIASKELNPKVNENIIQREAENVVSKEREEEKGKRLIPHIIVQNKQCKRGDHASIYKELKNAVPTDELPLSLFQNRKYDHQVFNDTNILPCLKNQLKYIAPKDKLREKPVRIYDGFLFNDELDMLEIRLNELYKVVDYFIIVESPITLQNKSKPLYFKENKSRFAKFNKQIIHVIVNSLPKKFEYWENESYFRSSIGAVGLKKLIERKFKMEESRLMDEVYSEADAPNDDDLINISDLDEIPSPDALYLLKWYNAYQLYNVIKLSMRWTYYGYTRDNGAPWDKCGIFPLKTLKEYSSGLYTNDIRGNCFLRSTFTFGGPSCFAGWHCSWCLHPKSYAKKIDSFAHSEMKDKVKRWGRKYETEEDVWGLLKEGHFFGTEDDMGHFVSVQAMKDQISKNMYMPLYMFTHFKQYPYVIYPDPSVTHY